MWLWIMLAVIALVVVGAIARAITLGPPVERLKKAIDDNAAPLNKLRCRLEEQHEVRWQRSRVILTSKSRDHLAMIRQSIQMVLASERDDIDGVVKLCNHRLYVLTLKRSIKEAAEWIAGAYAKVAGLLPCRIERRKLPVEEPLSLLLPLLVGLEEVLEPLPKIESEIARSARELGKISNPGVFRKVGYFFSPKTKRRDTDRLKQIRGHWHQYRTCWEKVREQWEVFYDRAGFVLSDYLHELMVMKLCHQVALQVVRRKGFVLEDLDRTIKWVRA